MFRAINTGIFSLRFYSEGIEQAVIVVLEAFTGMCRNIQLVRAFNKVKTLDKKLDFAGSRKFNRLVFLNVRIRSVATNSFCIENTYAKYKVLNGFCGANVKPDYKLIPAMEYMCFGLVVFKCYAINLNWS